ncbi:MAG: carboxypeptidase-like regulatory domain-containing protein [Muribaculaceae bacterium]|nr:carboxypeptidase-like regulatory domain-containing protein [Muribaculaceae bacterium]
MKRNSFLIFCFLLGLLRVSAAEPGELQGNVRDRVTDEPVKGVVVKAKGVFTSTDSEGKFRLMPKAGADSISFRCVGYETLTLPVSEDVAVIRLTPKTTRLKDVVIEAPDIYARGDTLVFNVSRYANAKDNAIIDVIKRLPGIKVEEDGTIKYQGKPINKFYIDGNDFIDGQYGLATNNISHKDVKSVEVMENHQPVKALEGIEFSEEAGINLKLKEDARDRWAGTLQAVAGVQPMLYDGSVFTMRIAPKMQNVFTVKADNTGWNPATEIKEHDFHDMFGTDYAGSLWPEYITADIANAPLSEKRNRDNLSWLGNAISAWKKGDTSIRLKLNYMADRLDYDSGVTTEYLSSDIPTFVQHDRLRTQTHDLSAQLNSETNKRGYFLKDKFTVNAVWDNSKSAVSGSFNIDQYVKRKSFSAVNDLKLVKRNEKRLFNLTSRNSFVREPDRLQVMGNEDAMQKMAISDFRSTTETQFGRLSRFWKFYVTGGLDLNYRRMNTSLSGMGSFDNSGVYNAFISNVYVSPRADYERNGWRVSLMARLKWLHYSIEGQHDYVTAMPWVHVRRQLTAKSELSASVMYSVGAPQAYLFIEAPVLSDYRNLFVPFNPDKYSHDVSGSVKYAYRNPLKALFVNASAAYNYQSLAIMANQIFIDDFIVSTYSDRLSHKDTWAVSGGVSKGLGHSRFVVGCDVNGSVAEASSMRDSEVVEYRQTGAGVKPYLRGSVLRWLSVNYEGNYDVAALRIREEANIYHSLRQNLFVTVMANDAVQFTVGAEHFMTVFPEGNMANLVLLDASAVWRVSNRVRLSLTANNLLDRRRYEYVSYGTLARSEYSFGIRRRNVVASVQYRF